MGMVATMANMGVVQVGLVNWQLTSRTDGWLVVATKCGVVSIADPELHCVHHRESREGLTTRFKNSHCFESLRECYPMAEASKVLTTGMRTRTAR